VKGLGHLRRKIFCQDRQRSLNATEPPTAQSQDPQPVAAITHEWPGLVDGADALGNLLANALQAYLAEVSVRQNTDMRRISAWAAIWAVPTLLAGIYGMNFRHMPELSWRFGYPLVLVMMVATCLGLYRAFRHYGWL
jgi:Mg2+ and Co2+ transporter CorA